MNGNYIIESISFGNSLANMLSGIMPETVNDTEPGNFLSVRMAADVVNKEYLHFLTANTKDDYVQHVDIDAAAYTLVYDMGVKRPVEYFYLSSYKGATGIYAIGKFEIYVSDTRENLFDPKNRVILFDNDDGALSAGVAGNDFSVKITANVSCRYIAFKQLSTNAKDEISRIGVFGAYSEEYDHCSRYVAKNYGTAFPMSVKCGEGIIAGNTDFATDKNVFEDQTAIKMCDGSLEFAFKYNKAVSKIVIIGTECGKITVTADKTYSDLVPEVKPSEKGRNTYTYNVSAKESVSGMTVKFAGNTEFDQVLAFSDISEITVDTDCVITPDFLGVGANALPTHLFDYGRVQGFNEAYFEVEKRRVAIAKPSVVRLWFQVDWFVMDHDGYVNRKYCFNSPKMQAVYKELDAFKAAGVEVELNYGWKVSCAAQEWFSFPDVFIRRASAPRDIEHFATSCSDCLRELIVNRGYDNIKYLTFYNESNGGYPGGWDFLCPKGYDLKAYWKEMFLKVDAQLKADGLRDKVKYFVAETGSTGPQAYLKDVAGEWMDYFNKNVGNMYEYSNFHQYAANYREALANGLKAQEIAGNHPVLVSEYDVYDSFEKLNNNDYSFERNNIAATLGYMNGGISGMLFWILSGAFVDEAFWLNDPEASFWRSPVTKCEPSLDNISLPFYQLSLFTNYIPCHSSILKSAPSDDNSHTVAAVTKDGDYTVAIESKAAESNKKIRFNFGKNINKKFYKHVFTLDVVPEGNMIIPPSVKEIDVTDTLCDTIDKDYSFVVYTTIPPREQVVLEKTYVCVAPGEQVKLNAKTVDGNGKITWSMCDVHTTSGFKGEITEDGLYTADGENYGNFSSAFGMNAIFAAKAQSDSGEYAICLIEIKK